MIIRATISSPTDALIPNKIVRTKVVTLKFGSGINILDAPPSGSITGAMLQDGVVTTTKLAEEAVTTSKIAKRAVETAQLADRSVTTEKIKPGAVDWDRLDYELQEAIKAGGGGPGGDIPEAIAAALRDKYNKTGGRISGSATVGGDLKVERSIESENDIVADRDLTAKRRTTTKELDVSVVAYIQKLMQSPSFLSGWSGMGFQIRQREDGKWIAEFDGVRARDFFEATEFIVNKVRAVGGELLVTNCNKSVGVTVFDARLFVDGVLNAADNGLLPLDGVFGEC